MNKNKTRGQSLVEFALILPILLMLLLGIIEGGRIVWAYITVQNAAREAARYAVSGQPLSRPDNRASDCAVIGGHPTGEPWDCPAVPTRVDRIKDVAVARANALGVQIFATQSITDFEEHRNDPAALGVLVKGQKTYNDIEGTPDFPGEQGLNVLVQIYYNVEMWDPIYRSLMYTITDAASPGNGFYHIHLEGAVMMQNEGIDTALGSLPPPGIDPVDLPDDDDSPPQTPPEDADLKVNGVDNWSGPAGTDITISLINGPQNEEVCIRWNGELIPDACQITEPDGSQTYPFYIPLTDVGPYLITAHAEGIEIAREFGDVTGSPSPAIVTNGDRWPVGTPICIGVVSHDPDTPYDLSFSTDANVVDRITTDGDGDALPGNDPPACDPASSFIIPSGLSPGDYWIKSWTIVAPTVVASKTISVIPTCIRLNQGACNEKQTVPAGSRVYVILSSHAPSREYNVYVVDSGGGERLIGDRVSTDGNGEVLFYWDLDPEEAWPNGDYTVISRDAAVASGRTGEVDLEISTPEGPFITIAGGYTWPAGSPISIQLRNHCGVDYDVYLINNDDPDDVTLIGEDFNADPPGSCNRWINWTIPISTVTGPYRIESRQGSSYESSTYVADVDLDIESVPNITIDGGNRHPPGVEITIRLNQHAANNEYDVYLINTDLDPGDPGYSTMLETVLANSDGSASLTYSIAPDDPGYVYVIQSRQAGEVIAETTLEVVPADLEVTDIQVPASPPFGKEFPITITIRNNGDLDLFDRSFDVDVYIDPPQAPALDTSLPPGDRKVWVSGVPANSSITVDVNISLFGSSWHTIYARADTTNYIIEVDEDNNMDSVLVPPPLGCSFVITDTFDSGLGTDWEFIQYGNADQGAGPTINSGRLRLDNDGSSTWNSNDDIQGGFAVLVRELAGNYDFDVAVRVLRVPTDDGKTGLTVRDGRDGRELKVDWTWYRNPSALQAAYRDSVGDSTKRAGGNISQSYPIWLRIRRAGSTFIYSYATSSSMPAMDSADWVDATQITVEMDDDILVGLLNTPYDNGGEDYGEFDDFYMCVREASPPTTFPPGYEQCTEVIENGRLEDPPLPTNAAGWVRNEDGSVVRNTANPHWVEAGERYGFALLAEYIPGPGALSPWVYQEVVFPNWINDSTTGVLTLQKGVYWVTGSQRPGDALMFNLRGTPSISPSVPITIATGADTPNYPPPSDSNNERLREVSVDVMSSVVVDPTEYAGKPVQAWFYADNPGDYATEFFLDNISLQVCTSEPEPDRIPGTGKVSGRVWRIPPGRPPEIVPGTMVWIWAEDVPLRTTFVIQDGTYSFYNLEPANNYKVYFQYEDADRTYWYLATIDVDADDDITLNVTLF